MPYDSALDACVFTKSWENDSTRVTVSVYSYNNGPKKLQITRENKLASGEYRYTRLGRLSHEELSAVMPLIQEASGLMA